MIERGSCVPSSMPEPGGERARRHVADHHFERNDLHLANQLLAHVQAADEVGRDADLVQMLEEVFRDPVVEHALAVDHFMLLGIEGGRVILEVLDQRTGFRALIEDLRLALIDATATIHRRVPWFEKIHCRGSWGWSFFKIRGWRMRGFSPALRSQGNLSDPLGKHNAGRGLHGGSPVKAPSSRWGASGDLRECALISHEGPMVQENDQMTAFDDRKECLREAVRP